MAGSEQTIHHVSWVQIKFQQPVQIASISITASSHAVGADKTMFRAGWARDLFSAAAARFVPVLTAFHAPSRNVPALEVRAVQLVRRLRLPHTAGLMRGAVNDTVVISLSNLFTVVCCIRCVEGSASALHDLNIAHLLPVQKRCKTNGI